MKHIIIVGDGMADEPLDELGGKTPLQVAHTPFMDMLAKKGITGMIKTIPDGFHPGSEVANMMILGYDPHTSYEGRAVLEAASMGINLGNNELAIRCNLICIEQGRLKNHSAGHISSEESQILIHCLNERLSNDRIRFYPGISYKHLLIIKGGDKRLICTPPHDKPLQPFEPLMVKPLVPEAQDTADILNRLILVSQKILQKHPVNERRIAAGKDSANSIWPWSPGYKPKQMRTMGSIFGFQKGAVISAVDLIRGIAIYAGLDIIKVNGANGLYNTNYDGKAQAAVEALKTYDFVFVHVEASDEAGHEGNVALKTRTIEQLDQHIIGYIFNRLNEINEPVAIAVLPDHPTPCATRTHSNKPVPFLIYKPGNKPDRVSSFDEFTIKKGQCGLLENDAFIHLLMGDK